MKLLLAFVLCGLSCCLALPTCDDSEANKCGTSRKIDPDKFAPETEAEMDEICSVYEKELDCQIAFADRCPNTLLGAMRKALGVYRTALEKLCDKEGPLRKKFIEKSVCINREQRAGEAECAEKVKEPDYCKKAEETLKCAEEEMNRRCGRDGSAVYAEMYKPKYAFQTIFCGEHEE